MKNENEDEDIIVDELSEQPKSEETRKSDLDSALNKLLNSLNLPKEMEELIDSISTDLKK